MPKRHQTPNRQSVAAKNDEVPIGQVLQKHWHGKYIEVTRVEDGYSRLGINHEEAQKVRYMFRRYIELGSAREVTKEVNASGWQAKSWVTKNGELRGGKEWNIAKMHRLLSNRVYIGEIEHSSGIHQGEHEAIIERATWDLAEAKRIENTRAKKTNRQSMHSLLGGLASCGHCGGAFTTSYTVKKGKRYSYYVCLKDAKRAKRSCPVRSLPMAGIDKMIAAQILKIFKTPDNMRALMDEVKRAQETETRALLERREIIHDDIKTAKAELNIETDTRLSEKKFADLNHQVMIAEKQIRQIDAELGNLQKTKLSAKALGDSFATLEYFWEQLFPSERSRIVRLLIKEVTFTTEGIKLVINTGRIASLVKEVVGDEPPAQSKPAPDEASASPRHTAKDGAITKTRKNGDIAIFIPMTIVRRYGQKKYIVNEIMTGDNEGVNLESPLLNMLVLAEGWTRLMEDGKVASLSELARLKNLDLAYVGKIIRFAHLSPAIKERIINDQITGGMSISKMRRGIPLDWDEQWQLFCAADY